MNVKDIKDFSELIGLDSIIFSHSRYRRDDTARDVLNANLETNYKVFFGKKVREAALTGARQTLTGLEKISSF